MEVRYENTLDDMVALTRYGIDHLPLYRDFRRRRVFSLYVTPLLLVAVFCGVGSVTDLPGAKIGATVGGIIGGLSAFFINRRFFAQFPQKAVDKLHRESPQIGVFCPHILTVTPEGVTEQTEVSRSFHTWAGLTEVAFMPDYIYLFITSVTAHMVPRRELGDQAFQQLTDEIQRLRNAPPVALSAGPGADSAAG